MLAFVIFCHSGEDTVTFDNKPFKVSNIQSNHTPIPPTSTDLCTKWDF